MGTRNHRDHRNGDGFGNMTPADIAKALNQRQNVKLELDYEHVHAPLAHPVCASVVIGNVLKIIAIGGTDHVTQLAHDLFVAHQDTMTPEDCIARAQKFYGAVGREAMRMAADAAAARAELPENGDQASGIVLP